MVGIYAAKLAESGQAGRSFRLMLYVELPDRIHGEILSPLGTPEVLLDGGAGRLAITLVNKRVSYVGPTQPAALAPILGLPLALDALVRGVLYGAPGEGRYRLRRSPGREGALPEWLEIEAEGTYLSLRLKRTRRLRAFPTDLGTGRAPDGTTIRPLDEFEDTGG